MLSSIFCKYQLLYVRYEDEIGVFIYASKILESEEKNEMHLHKLCIYINV